MKRNKKNDNKMSKQNIFLRFILDQESDKLNDVIQFTGMSDEERKKLMTIIRGFAVVVARRFVKVEIWINSIVLLVAAIVAYAVINYFK